MPANLPSVLAEVTWPLVAAGLTGLLVVAAVTAGLAWLTRRAARALNRAVGRGGLTGRRVLITLAILAAIGVAGIGGARSFTAVSDKFHSPLVPLVADGMIIACTALRLAALTRGWRIPGALVTTYLFIGGTVWLNIDTATGIADGLAHALAPVAYAVLVEMLAHLLRLHLRLAHPTRARLNALTWLTSPVITTRVWLHLARTGSDDPVQARALVQQVVRMSSRLNTVCPSRTLWPLDSARPARTAALQTIRDGLLSAADLAALLPAGRLTPGALLALVDAAALGLTRTVHEGDAHEPAPAHHPSWLAAYLLGALAAAPVHTPDRTDDPAPLHRTGPNGAAAPEQEPHRTGTDPVHKAGPSKPAPSKARDDRSDEALLAVLHRHSVTEHDGEPLGQREIIRVTNCGFGRAKRLQELAGWAEPTDRPRGGPGEPDPPSDTTGQLALVAATEETPSHTTDHSPNDDDTDTTPTDRELETSSSR